MKKYLQHHFGISTQGASNIIRASCANFIVMIVSMIPPGVGIWFIAEVLQGLRRPYYVYAVIIALSFVLLLLVLLREYKLNYDVTYEESASLRVYIAEKLKQLPLAYFSKHNLTDLSQSVMMDVSNIEMVISHAIPSFIGYVGFLALISVLCIIGQPVLGCLALLPIWLTLLLMLLTKRIQLKMVHQYYDRLLKNSAIFQESFDMQQEIKSNAMQARVKQSVFAALEQTEALHLKSEFTMASIVSAIALLPFAAPALVAIVGSYLLSLESISLLYFIGYLVSSYTLAAQFTGINQFLLMIFFFEDSYQRIRAMREEPIQTGTDFQFDCFDVTLQDVEFSYDATEVIKGVSFTAKQGQTTALVGPSGCGKTTILRLISRLYDYDRGNIFIGDKDILAASTESLFKNISIVFQNVELFDNTVLENIRIGRKDATDEEVLEAARLANVDSIVQRLPQGYQTMIGENGSRLSGGERQRISIARAFLKDAPIILLDEISASLDVENERAIQKSLVSLVHNKTVIIISHRLRSIEQVDQIVVMKDGRVEASGTHEELLEISPTYRNMLEKSAKTETFNYLVK